MLHTSFVNYMYLYLYTIISLLFCRVEPNVFHDKALVEMKKIVNEIHPVSKLAYLSIFFSVCVKTSTNCMYMLA